MHGFLKHRDVCVCVCVYIYRLLSPRERERASVKREERERESESGRGAFRSNVLICIINAHAVHTRARAHLEEVVVLLLR